MKKLILLLLVPIVGGLAVMALRRNRPHEELVTASGEPMNPEALLADTGASIRPQRAEGGDWR
jgi:hypothetical protein